MQMRPSRIWLLLVADYGLANGEARWKYMAVELLLKLGFFQFKDVVQLFYRLLIVSRAGLAKIVDDIVLKRVNDETAKFLQEFYKVSSLGR